MCLGSELPAYASPAGLELVAMKMACDIADIWSEGWAARYKQKDVQVCEEWLAPTGRFVRFLKATGASKADELGARAQGCSCLGALPPRTSTYSSSTPS
mmetsp:Transcript_70622/g.138819  ORF Transcript_70622/g.138819 Transcript_70622/m.138819 type:complete len:99 (+) Transcript_70622:559-855(+)